MFTKVSKDPAVFVQMGVTEDELRNDTNPGFQARERQDLAFQVESTSFIVKTIKQHPNYSSTNEQNDISVQFSQSVSDLAR